MAKTSIMSKLRDYWFQPVNNSPLITFRFLYSAIMIMQFGGAITSNWVKEVYIEAPMRFNFIGFEFLQHMQGPIMYYYFGFACLLAVLVGIGLFYRPAIIMLALMWTAVYFSQKGHYNNHYYLMVLISWIMSLMPANKRASLDVRFGFTTATNECHRWCIQAFIIQIAIVYVYASIAKMYPDWLQAKPVTIWFSKRANDPHVGFLFREQWFCYFISYTGIIFDLLIVPALLWKPTRNLAVGFMLLFHYFNGMVFGIGVFPYLAMSLNVFFFPGKTFDNVVGIIKKPSKLELPHISKQKFIVGVLSIYIVWQVLLPLRHHLIPGDVLWTEEGHRLSWRMMLRTKGGRSTFTVKDKRSDSVWKVNPYDHLLKHQAKDVASKPDFIWQFAQKLKNDYSEKGYDVSVYAKSYCRVNGRSEKLLVDTTVDLANVKWHRFKHHDWVLLDFE